MEAKTYTPLASFIDLLMDAVFAVDVDARIVFASASCERIFGYTPQEMIGSALSYPLVIDGNKLNIVPSIGIALYPKHGNNEKALLKHADKTVYVVKKAITAGL